MGVTTGCQGESLRVATHRVALWPTGTPEGLRGTRVRLFGLGQALGVGEPRPIEWPVRIRWLRATSPRDIAAASRRWWACSRIEWRELIGRGGIVPLPLIVRQQASRCDHDRRLRDRGSSRSVREVPDSPQSGDHRSRRRLIAMASATSLRRTQPLSASQATDPQVPAFPA